MSCTAKAFASQSNHNVSILIQKSDEPFKTFYHIFAVIQSAFHTIIINNIIIQSSLLHCFLGKRKIKIFPPPIVIHELIPIKI